MKCLRQAKGSVLPYSAKFRRLSSETEYNDDDALFNLFRNGSKDDINDVLATCFDEPTDLENITNFTIKKID